jgi:hypothetical protein
MMLVQIGDLLVGKTGEYVEEQAVLLFRREELLEVLQHEIWGSAATDKERLL